MPEIQQQPRSIPKFLYIGPDRSYVLVSADEERQNYWIHVGDSTRMRLIPDCVHAPAVRGRGITLNTGEQKFYGGDYNWQREPQLLSPPTWGATQLSQLNLTDYDIVENSDGTVTVTKK